MINVERTGHTAVEVKDIGKAIDFYVENFGFIEGYRAEDWGIVRKNGDDIAFIKKGIAHHPPHFGLRVETAEEIDSAFIELKKVGVKILKDPKLHRDGSYSFYFSDIDDNIIELIHDPNAKR